MSIQAKKLLSLIRSHDALVGVIGMGYVGLPLSLAFAERGFKVLGFDTDEAKVEALSRGECYIKHISAGRVHACASAGHFSATSDLGRLGDPDVLIVCVPTPLTDHKSPDMSFVKENARQIGGSLRQGQLVVLESTTYPGTTDELVRNELERSGLRGGEDFFLAFSPEREDPGNPDFGTSDIPKVIGGVDALSGDIAQALYAEVVPETVRVSSTRAAEATKLTENIFRAVNIALVNELKIVFSRMGIDIWEVLDAAATKPFGFMRFNPGPGWGGHCIPVDPFYLSWKAKEYDVPARFIELAGEVNMAMPEWVVGKVQGALNGVGRPVRGSRILILGLAYKKDVADARESPALQIMTLLERLGADIDFHDPFFPEFPPTRKHPGYAGKRSVKLSADNLETYDAAVVVTDHSAVDYEQIARHSRLIVDARGVYRNRYPGFEDIVVNA